MLLTTQGGRLSYADFSGSAVNGSDFGGAYLEKARFRGCRIEQTSFAVVTAETVRAPLRAENAPYSSFLMGADFNGSVLIDVSYAGAYLTAASFDGALLIRPDFRGTGLSAATMKGAVLLAPLLDGAEMKSLDLDGAVVFGAGWLEAVSGLAEPGTFRPELYQAEPMTLAEVMAINIVYQTLEEAEVTAITGGAPAFRLKRVLPFTD